MKISSEDYKAGCAGLAILALFGAAYCAVIFVIVYVAVIAYKAAMH